MATSRWFRLWPHIRDIAVFIAGLLGIAHETLVNHGERPNLLILYGAMLSLPIFTRDAPKP